MRIARATRLRTTAALITALALSAAAGCGSGSGSEDSSNGSGGKTTVGIAMPTKASTRWLADGSNMVAQFQAKGYQTDLRYGDDNVDNQVAQIQDMIRKGYKLLVIAAIDGLELGEVLLQARDAGVKVIAYDRLILATSDVDYYATFDNYKVGRLQAEYILDKLGLKDGSENGPFNIELFAGSSDDNNTRYFYNGSMDALKPYIDNKKLVVKSGQKRLTQVNTLRWDPSLAKSRMDYLLRTTYANSTVDAVLSPYDGISRGIIAALKKAGYGTSSLPLPIVTGQDAEIDSVKMIISGEQAETVYKDTRLLAEVAVQMGDAVLTGGKPKVNDTAQYNNGTKVVPSYLLEPVSVDKSNYQAQLIDSGYIKAADLAK